MYVPVAAPGKASQNKSQYLVSLKIYLSGYLSIFTFVVFAIRRTQISMRVVLGLGGGEFTLFILWLSAGDC